MRYPSPPGACPELWRTYEYDWSIGYIWHWSDWVERSIFIGLALMFGYTAFVVVRLSRRYYLARRESGALFADSTVASQTVHKSLVAELSHGVGALKSIAAAAPFLGLAGTCYGILGSFHGIGMERSTALGMIVAEVTASLVTTAAGVGVAIPAAVSYNFLRTRLEKFEIGRASTLLNLAPRSYGFAQTLYLQRRFSGCPAFALIVAPILAILIPMFALMLRSLVPVGLPVHLLKISTGNHDLPPIIISVVATNGTRRPLAYVNSKETSWDELGNALRTQLHVRPRRMVYVEGGDDVDWAYVADAIDVARGLHAEVVLLPATSKIESGHAHGAKTKRAKAQ